MPTRQEIIDAAVSHSEMVRQPPGVDVKLRYEVAAYEPAVRWAVWADDASPDSADMQIVKGRVKALDPATEWGAVVVPNEATAFEVQDMHGDGKDMLDREDRPAGALAA